MKKEFERSAKRSRMFAEQALVVTVCLQEASITRTVNDEVTGQQKFLPQEVKKELLSYLNAQGIKHEIVSEDSSTLEFAVAREKKADVNKALDEFFSGPRALALGMAMKFESYAPLAEIKNAIMKPFSKERQEVSKSIARLKNG